MILFFDEDRSYLNWVSHHRTGFALDTLRHPSKNHLLLQCSTCPEIKRSASKHTHWTTGKRMKACAVEIEQLQAWAREQAGHEPADCPHCAPQAAVDVEIHLTKLDRDLLDTVLDIAAIHMEENDHAYLLTIGMLVRCLDKTAGQLRSALERLCADGLLAVQGARQPGEGYSLRSAVFPTAQALRTLEGYAGLSAAEIAAELGKLTPGV